MLLRKFIVLILMVLFSLSACSSISTQGDSHKESIKPSQNEIKSFQDLEKFYKDKNYNVALYRYHRYYPKFKNKEVKKKANKIFNIAVKEIINKGDTKSIYSFFTADGFSLHKEVLSKDLQKKINLIVDNEKKKAVEKEKEANDVEKQVKQQDLKYEINNILETIDNKEFTLYLYEDDAKTNETISNLLNYGYALEEINNNNNSQLILEFLTSINPEFNGVRSKEIKTLVSKYITRDEWKKRYESQKDLNEVTEELNRQEEEQANKPLPTIGMTTEEVLNSRWGEPIDINKTTTANGTTEQWVYDDYKYLYFEDGILTTIQD